MYNNTTVSIYKSNSDETSLKTVKINLLINCPHRRNNNFLTQAIFRYKSFNYIVNKLITRNISCFSVNAGLNNKASTLVEVRTKSSEV